VTATGLVKVGDFGTSRFLEMAAHGTTVIGSPPYMAPEQVEGRAVFASDLYSLGVTMFQMMTGELPYDTPAPADLDRLRRGELVTSARLRNPQIPQAIDAILLRALSATVAGRYQRAEDLLGDILQARREVKRPAAPAAPMAARDAAPTEPRSPRRVVRQITPARVRGRDVGAGRFCWHCHKPLPARTSRCPFCGESQ
jgi:serine/threonine-protein kinase